MSTVLVRRLEQSDIDQVLALAGSLKEAPRWTREVYANAADRHASPQRIALVAEDSQDRLLGFAITLLIPPQAELETIGVAPAAQRKGIASLLFGRMIKELERLQITEVMLEVRESNRAARAFYGSLGFVESGRRQGYYTEPQEDALLLGRACGEVRKGAG